MKAKYDIGKLYKATGATPDESALLEYNGTSLTKNQWALTAKDSLFKTFDRALANHAAGYDITTGGNNCLLGVSAGRSDSPSGQLTTSSHWVVIGNNNISHSYIKVDWTVTSDERDKTDIQDITTGLDFVNQLKPKSFWFRKERGSDVKHGPKRLGFIAQDILALEGSDPIIINNEDTDSLRYTGSHLVPVLVNAIKELSAKVAALEAA